MPYNPNGSFSILNEIGTGYACNNALPPLIGADLDDIATGLSQTATVNGVLSNLVASSNNTALLASVLVPGVAVIVMQIGPCHLQANDVLQANAFVQVINNDFVNSHDCDTSLFITTTQAATSAASNSDRISGASINNESLILNGSDLTFHAVGNAVVSSSGAYYLNYVVNYNPSASSTINATASTICGINIARLRFPLGTL